MSYYMIQSFQSQGDALIAAIGQGVEDMTSVETSETGWTVRRTPDRYEGERLVVSLGTTSWYSAATLRHYGIDPAADPWTHYGPYDTAIDLALSTITPDWIRPTAGVAH